MWPHSLRVTFYICKSGCATYTHRLRHTYTELSSLFSSLNQKTSSNLGDSLSPQCAGRRWWLLFCVMGHFKNGALPPTSAFSLKARFKWDAGTAKIIQQCDFVLPCVSYKLGCSMCITCLVSTPEMPSLGGWCTGKLRYMRPLCMGSSTI